MMVIAPASPVVASNEWLMVPTNEWTFTVSSNEW